MTQKSNNLYVFTGGPGVGKTTLLDGLAEKGFRVIPEEARSIIAGELASGGNALPWVDNRLYTERMLDHSVATYRDFRESAEPLLFDRGIPDTLAHARMSGYPDIDKIERACRQYRYHPNVFYLPVEASIYHTDSERKQTFAEAIRTGEVIRDIYRQLGYRIISVPFMQPDRRVDFVREILISE